MEGELIKGIEDGAFDGATRALLRELRAYTAPLFVGPAQNPDLDVTERPPVEFNQQTRAPQITVTDFSSELQRPGGIGEEEIGSRDLDAMTVDVKPSPSLWMLEWNIAAVARWRWAARRMSESLTLYFVDAPHALVMEVQTAWGVETVTMPKGLARPFRETTVDNEGGLIFIEGRGRLYDVPLWSEAAVKMYLARRVEIGVTDMDTGQKLGESVVAQP